MCLLISCGSGQAPAWDQVHKGTSSGRFPIACALGPGNRTFDPGSPISGTVATRVRADRRLAVAPARADLVDHEQP